MKSMSVYIHGVGGGGREACGAAICHSFSHVWICGLVPYWNLPSEEWVLINGRFCIGYLDLRNVSYLSPGVITDQIVLTDDRHPLYSLAVCNV